MGRGLHGTQVGTGAVRTRAAGQLWAEEGPSEGRDRAGRVTAGRPGCASHTLGLFISFLRLRFESPLPTSWAPWQGS